MNTSPVTHKRIWLESDEELSKESPQKRSSTVEKTTRISQQSIPETTSSEISVSTPTRRYVPRLDSSDTQPSRLQPLPPLSSIEHAVIAEFEQIFSNEEAEPEVEVNPLQRIMEEYSDDVEDIKVLYAELSKAILDCLNKVFVRQGVIELVKLERGRWAFDIEKNVTKVLVGHLNIAFSKFRNRENKVIFDVVFKELLAHTFRFMTKTEEIEEHLNLCDPKFKKFFKPLVISEFQVDAHVIPFDDALPHSLLFLAERCLQWKQQNTAFISSKEPLLLQREIIGFLIKKTENGITLTSAKYEFDPLGKPICVSTDDDGQGFLILTSLCNPGEEISDHIALDSRNLELFYNNLELLGSYTPDGTPFFIIPDELELLKSALKNPKGNFHNRPTSIMHSDVITGNLLKQFSDASFLSFLNHSGAELIQSHWRTILKSRVEKIALHAPVLHNPLAAKMKAVLNSTEEDALLVNYGSLKEYQCRGINRLLNLYVNDVEGGLLCPEMGLGKTLMMTGIAKVILEKTGRPALFFGTVSTIVQTEESVRYWLGKYILEDFKNECESTLQKTVDSLVIYQNSGNRQASERQRLITPIQVLKKKLDALKKLHEDRKNELQNLIQELKQKKLNSPRKTLCKKDKAQKKDYKERLKTADALFKFTKDITKEMTDKFVAALHKLNLTEGWRTLSEPVDISQMNVYHHLVNRYDFAEKSFPLESIQDKPKIVFLTLEDLEGQKEKIYNINWSSLLIDECQSLCNIETQIYDQIHKLFHHLRGKNVNCFKIFSTGTPIQNSLSDVVSYLQLIEPTANQENGVQSYSLKDIANSIIKLQHNSAESISKAAEDPTQLNLKAAYKELKSVFCQTEGFKKLLKEVSFVCKRTDEDIQAQWGERIPGVQPLNHRIQFEEQQVEQRVMAEQIHETFKAKSTQAANEEKCFFTYAKQIGRTLIHPDLNVVEAERKLLVRRLADMDPDQFRAWAQKSSILTFLMNDDQFMENIQKGVLIFVDQIAVGDIMKMFIEKLFPEGSVDFLEGNTSEIQRRRMVLGFEKQLDEKTRVLIMMDQAGSAGIDLKKNGQDVYLLNIGNFNPATDKQALSRVVRADSDKDEVRVHTVDCGTPFEALVRWHKQRKEFEADYLFTWLAEDQSNNLKLFKLLFEASSRLIRTLRFAELGQDRVNAAWNSFRTQFLHDLELENDLNVANPLANA